MDFILKHQKLLVAGTATLVALGISKYFLSDDNDEDKKTTTKKEKEEETEVDQIQKKYGMTKEEAKEKLQELLKKVKNSSEEAFKEAVRKDIKVEYYGDVLSDKTIKIIMHRSVLLCLDSLTKIHETMTLERRNKYNSLVEYAAQANELIKNYFYVLNISMENITQILDITYELFQKSLVYWQNQQKLPKGYIRDLAWHFMAEAQVKVPMSREGYIKYLSFICEEIPKQQDELKQALSQAAPQLQRIVVLARAEDNAYFKMNVSDLEAMKALSLYSSDPICKELLERRNSLLNQLFKGI